MHKKAKKISPPTLQPIGAIQALFDITGEHTTLMSDDIRSIYLIPRRNRKGGFRFEVCDGSKSRRGYCKTFTDLRKAVAHFREIQKIGGWSEMILQGMLPEVLEPYISKPNKKAAKRKK